MTPWQLAKDSESSQQQALFCFVNMAIQYGFKYAKNPNNWIPMKHGEIRDCGNPVLELAWYHAIPNGGSRGDTARSRAIEGGRMKAEGVRPGVLDTFWPLIRELPNADNRLYCGLYIELKKPALKNPKNAYAGLSDEQTAFGEFCIGQNYCCKIAYSWLEAVEILEWYYNL